MRKPLSPAQSRLLQVGKAHDAAHLDAHNAYKRKFAEVASEFGLPLPQTAMELLETEVYPPEFWDAMQEHQDALVGATLAAQEARRTSTRNTTGPRRR